MIVSELQDDEDQNLSRELVSEPQNTTEDECQRMEYLAKGYEIERDSGKARSGEDFQAQHLQREDSVSLRLKERKRIERRHSQ